MTPPSHDACEGDPGRRGAFYGGLVSVNRRSVEKDEEVAMAVIDEEITAVPKTHFREDTAVSSPVTVSDNRIPLHRRLLTLLLRPIRPEM